ncbi:hypothetical protein P9112_008152 [Eukaryota sp. TZLM1-RC]
MVSIRLATPDDLPLVQDCNLHCLPENYNLKYYLYHATTWPQLLWVAEDCGSIVGYVLSKMEENAQIPHGHITSVAVIRTHRKLGLATKMMRLAHKMMKEVFGAKYCSLHVRVSNAAAYHMYHEVLGYRIHTTEKGYYADGEDALDMRIDFL